jgi:hypothetical protein
LKIQSGHNYTCRNCRKRLIYNTVAPNAVLPVVQKPYTPPPVVITTPTPTPKPVGPVYRIFTRLVNGVLTNERVLVND